jgi:hypothetical protein
LLLFCEGAGRVVRGFLKHFAPDEFHPDEISILEDALDDACRRIECSKAPWASDDYAVTGRTILAKYIIAMAKGGERDAKCKALECYRAAQKAADPPPGTPCSTLPFNGCVTVKIWGPGTSLNAIN